MSLAKTFMAIGIAIIFALFIGYAVHVIYEPPSYAVYADYEDYKQVQEQYNLNLLIILAIIGVITIAVGIGLSSFANLESVSSGLLGGGIITVIHGVIRSWSVLNKFLRLGILFAILIFFNLVRAMVRT